MTWTNFSLLLVGAYGLYYGLNLLVDYLRQPASHADPHTVNLRLLDELQPIVIDPDTLTSQGEHTMKHASPAKTEPEEEADFKLDGEASQRTVPWPDQQVESGGVSIGEMIRLYRQKAILQSARYDFTN